MTAKDASQQCLCKAEEIILLPVLRWLQLRADS